MKKTIVGAIALLLLFQINSQAQTLRRSVIASIGASGSVGNVRLSCTAGQPPNAGTISNGASTLRQGFQQPISGGIDPACVGLPMAIFSYASLVDACGEHFSFTYLDVPEDNTSFQWSFGQDAFPPVSDLKDPTNVGFATTGIKTITLQVTTGACVNTSTQQINVVKASFGAFATANTVLCSDDRSGVISLQVVNGTAPYQYKWSNGESTAGIENLVPGTYGFTVTDAAGCRYDWEASVTGPDSIRIATQVTSETCTGENNGAISLEVSGGQAPYTFLWSNGATTKDLSGLSGGDYSLVVTDGSGCVKNLALTIGTICEEIQFPELITPNGDGSNDTWVIPGLEAFPKNELEIFSRWGHPVFTAKPYDNTWNGTNKDGSALPVGAYFFVLRLNDAGKKVFDGSISILR